MVSFKTLSFLALAGSALAAPAPGRRGKHTVWKTVVATAYVTVPYGNHPAPTASTSSAAPPAYQTTVVVEQPKPTTSSAPVYSSFYTSEAPVYTSVAPSSEAPKPSSTSTPPATPSTGTYMDTVNEWRGKLGLKDLTLDTTLQSNAARTAKEGNGQMVHHLYPGSFGQVLAPGQPDEFYHVFVGGWLCEKPDMAGMNGVCATASEGWYYTSTGHADILTSDSYSKIGCGCEGGIWACDLA